MTARALVGAVLRRLAPRTVLALETVPVLDQRLHDVEAALARLREDLQGRSRQVEDLERSLAEVESGLAESRRMSLRVAQMTDLVFDRLMASTDGSGGH
ncbi:hypothetical protein SAMN05660464_1656 [Geodermatophilus dictyosporus]|uniref:Uncharacterized protein n=1 Tax=Geodermatophilus dictyosporus TaxID=1523247 RepID=A0A1I5LBH2_9ACTN|nr:hypothetical protein [Geodermatophilus dictyosporus]SFO94543.1 hypothetical protein SAMN05660464_1656 [Geodermatophilus dictyosporus]